jgi:hypothetical protein
MDVLECFNKCSFFVFFALKQHGKHAMESDSFLVNSSGGLDVNSAIVAVNATQPAEDDEDGLPDLVPIGEFFGHKRDKAVAENVTGKQKEYSNVRNENQIMMTLLDRIPCCFGFFRYETITMTYRILFQFRLANSFVTNARALIIAA